MVEQPAPVSFDRKTAAELLEEPSTLATTILAILLPVYGEQVFTADPVELYARIGTDFHCQLSEEGENRLNAMILALTTDGFYADPEIFESVCKSLESGDISDLVDGAVEPLSVHEVLWAIFEVGLAEQEGHPFSKAVDEIIEQTLSDENSDRGLDYTTEHIEQKKVELHTQLKKLGVDSTMITNHTT